MSQHAKMMMQRRYAHACDLGEIVHTHRLRVGTSFRFDAPTPMAG